MVGRDNCLSPAIRTERARTDDLCILAIIAQHSLTLWTKEPLSCNCKIIIGSDIGADHMVEDR